VSGGSSWEVAKSCPRAFELSRSACVRPKRATSPLPQVGPEVRIWGILQRSKGHKRHSAAAGLEVCPAGVKRASCWDGTWATGSPQRRQQAGASGETVWLSQPNCSV
jgi:hypothetical protein